LRKLNEGTEMYSNSQTNEIIEHIKTEYGAEPEFLWPNRYPGDHIFPAYHMNKNNWITIWLDGTLPNGLVFELIKKSYLLSDK